MRQNALLQLIAVSPDTAPAMSQRLHNCCDDYTRSQLLRGAAAEAGQGPAGDRAGDAGAGRDRALAALASSPARRAGAGRLRRLEDPALGLRGRDRPGRRRPTRSSSRSSSTAASTRSACSPRSATRATRSCGPAWRSPPGAGAAFSEDSRLQWHPAAAALATLHAERKVSVFPAIGYDHPDQSHFTSRHYYEVGELAVGYRTGWLGRYIDLVGDDENPLQGLSMDGSLSPMIATANRPVAAIDSVDGYDLWSPVSDPIRGEMYRSFARFGALPAGLARPRPGPPRRHPDRQTAPGPGRVRRLHQPGRLPRHPLRPQARRPRRIHRSRAADAGGDDPRPRRLRHPRRPGRRPRTQPAPDLRGRCSPSSATSKRAGSPTGS